MNFKKKTIFSKTITVNFRLYKYLYIRIDVQKKFEKLRTKIHQIKTKIKIL